MKIIEVEAVPREGFGSRWRAHREFKPGEPVRLEVLDQEHDFIKGFDEHNQPEHDPETSVDAEVTNSTTGKVTKVKRPHPTRIGRKGYEEIMADPVLRVREGGDLSAGLSREALDAARKQASDMGGKLAEAHAQIAELTAENARLKARLQGGGGEGGKPGKAADEEATGKPHESLGGGDTGKHGKAEESATGKTQVDLEDTRGSGKGGKGGGK